VPESSTRATDNAMKGQDAALSVIRMHEVQMQFVFSSMATHLVTRR
jgi:hypothetical protein